MLPINTFMLIVFGLIFVMVMSPLTAEEIPRIILDTDIRGDCDDAGALAMLHALADNGECEILGVIASTTGPHVASVIGAINNFYGRPDLPVGLYHGIGIRGEDGYAPVVGDPGWFPSRVSNETAVESTALYRRLLNQSPDNSVSIVVIGGQPCVYELLISDADYEGDGSIDKTGKVLIETKVKELVLMAASFVNPDHREWNVILDVPAAKLVAEEWPGRIVYSGFEIGWVINTGGTLEDPELNPVAKSYELYRHTEGGVGNIGNRASWDQTAVYYAVRGLKHNEQPIWSLEGPISVSYTDEGHTLFEDNPNANRFRMVQEMPIEETEALIEALMVQAPQSHVMLIHPSQGAAYKTGQPIPLEVKYSGTSSNLKNEVIHIGKYGEVFEKTGALESSHIIETPGMYVFQAYAEFEDGAAFYSNRNLISIVPASTSTGDNDKNPDVNLALLESATVSGSVASDSGRGTPADILYDPASDAYSTVTDWNEYGVAYQEDLGIVTEDDPFYWQVDWNNLKSINEITIGGTYQNQPQPLARWKVEYRYQDSWHTLQEGQGGWLNTGIFHWHGVDDAKIVADAVRVVVFSDGQHPLKSVHLRGSGGISNREDDSKTEPKATIIRYR